MKDIYTHKENSYLRLLEEWDLESVECSHSNLVSVYLSFGFICDSVRIQTCKNVLSFSRPWKRLKYNGGSSLNGMAVSHPLPPRLGESLQKREQKES